MLKVEELSGDICQLLYFSLRIKSQLLIEKMFCLPYLNNGNETKWLIIAPCCWAWGGLENTEDRPGYSCSDIEKHPKVISDYLWRHSCRLLLHTFKLQKWRQWPLPFPWMNSTSLIPYHLQEMDYNTKPAKSYKHNSPLLKQLSFSKNCSKLSFNMAFANSGKTWF